MGVSEPTSFSTRISEFERILTETIDSVWKVRDWKTYLKDMSQGAGIISQEIIAIGKISAEAISSLPKDLSSEIHHHYLISFSWIDQAKLFLVLWRDICFEQQKAYFLSLEGRVKKTKLRQSRLDSHAVVSQAAKELFALFNGEKGEPSSDFGIKKRQLDQWALQQSPWSVYEEQLSELNHQCEHLLEHFAMLRDSHLQFKKIKTLIDETLKMCEKDLVAVEQTFEQTKATIAEVLKDSDSLNPSKIINHIDNVEEDIPAIEYGILFNEALEIQLKELLQKQNVPVQVDGGWIQFREIFYQRTAQQWLESNILPLLYEIWEITESLKIEKKNNLVNIRNRAVLLANELKENRDFEFRGVNFFQPIGLFRSRLDRQKEEFDQLRNLIYERLDKEFLVGNVFTSKDEFLPVSIQYTLNSFKIGQEKYLGAAQQWLGLQVGRVQKLIRQVEEEDILSISEKVVRFLKSRQVHEDNHHYSSIFLTKGYIGESFWVGREEKLTHLERLIENWKNGFRGAVLLTGSRLCGKTFLGDLVSHHSFPENTLKIKPEQALEVEGRILPPTYDLAKVLGFIKKYSLQNRPLIWIDDLETWCNPSISLSQNLSSLIETVDNHSHQLFFLVSMSTWAKARMEQFHPLEEVFQAEINLDKMPTSEIAKAILIRHGATHDTLVDHQGNEVSPQKLRRMIKRVANASHENIGDALNLWAAAIKRVEAEKVEFHFRSNFGLPVFKEGDALLVLATLLLEKQTNEYRLNKLFGAAFQSQYSHVLQRLINVGLIVRRADGMLQINDLAANELAQFLALQNYIKLSN